MQYVLARLSESSTYAALAALLAGAGVVIPPGIWQDITLAGMIAAGVAGVVMKEGWKKAVESGDVVKAAEAVVKEQ